MRDPRFSWSYPWQSESALGLRIVRVLSAGFFVPDRRMWRRRDALDAPAPVSAQMLGRTFLIG